MQRVQQFFNRIYYYCILLSFNAKTKTLLHFYGHEVVGINGYMFSFRNTTFVENSRREQVEATRFRIGSYSETIMLIIFLSFSTLWSSLGTEHYCQPVLPKRTMTQNNLLLIRLDTYDCASWIMVFSLSTDYLVREICFQGSLSIFVAFFTWDEWSQKS